MRKFRWLKFSFKFVRDYCYVFSSEEAMYPTNNKNTNTKLDRHNSDNRIALLKVK